MSHRAVSLRDLPADLPPDAGDTIEVRSADGFVSQLTRAIIELAAVPWVAVEDPGIRGRICRAKASPPGHSTWQNPAAAGVASEQWSYELAALTVAASPARRWPAIAVDASVAPDAPPRRGQAMFISNCLACHQRGGDGNDWPRSAPAKPAVTYLTRRGLRALIRNPSAERHWPAQQMPAFDAATIPDADIDAVIAYLRYRGERCISWPWRSNRTEAPRNEQRTSAPDFCTSQLLDFAHPALWCEILEFRSETT